MATILQQSDWIVSVPAAISVVNGGHFTPGVSGSKCLRVNLAALGGGPLVMDITNAQRIAEGAGKTVDGVEIFANATALGPTLAVGQGVIIGAFCRANGWTVAGPTAPLFYAFLVVTMTNSGPMCMAMLARFNVPGGGVPLISGPVTLTGPIIGFRMWAIDQPNGDVALALDVNQGGVWTQVVEGLDPDSPLHGVRGSWGIIAGPSGTPFNPGQTLDLDGFKITDTAPPVAPPLVYPLLDDFGDNSWL